MTEKRYLITGVGCGGCEVIKKSMAAEIASGSLGVIDITDEGFPLVEKLGLRHVPDFIVVENSPDGRVTVRKESDDSTYELESWDFR